MTATACASQPATWTDAHLHVWDTAVLAPPWLAEAPQFAGKFDIARYLRDGGERAGMVFVEADVAPADRAREAKLFAEWGNAARLPFATIAGIEPGVERFSAECDAIGRVLGVRGARRVLHGAKIPFATVDFARDIRALGASALVFDFCVRWTDLALIEQIAYGAPEASLVLDHLGNPPIRSGWASSDCAAWQRLVARVAACPNVCVKWSAMFENAGGAMTADEIRPWFEWCLTCFGPTRLMWGSNWPVCFAPSSSARLSQWIEACAALGRKLGADEQAAIFGSTARRCYRLS